MSSFRQKSRGSESTTLSLNFHACYIHINFILSDSSILIIFHTLYILSVLFQQRAKPSLKPIHKLFHNSLCPSPNFQCPIYPLYSPVVTACTARFNVHKLYVQPTQCVCVLCGSQNKQRLFPHTALTDFL
jgi:hypothetical protein